MLEIQLRRLKAFLYSAKEQQAFLEDMASLIDDGVAANKAVEMLSKISKGTDLDVTQSILRKISQGRYIADGMQSWFPPAIVELVRAGEQGGTIAESLHAASDSLTRKSGAVASLLSSLLYPLAVLIAGLSVMVYMNHSVFKQFESIKPIYEWPTNGQELVYFANIIQHWWWLSAVIIVVSAVAIAKMLRDYVGPTRKLIDHIPLLALYRQLSAARVMETLGLLIGNGVVFKQALKIMQYQATPYLAYHLLLMEHRLGTGRQNIAEVLDTGMIDDEDIIRLRAVGESKGFEHALIRQGHYATEKGNKTIRTTGKITGGVLLACGAMLAGFMVTTLYAVGSSLGAQ